MSGNYSPLAYKYAYLLPKTKKHYRYYYEILYHETSEIDSEILTIKRTTEKAILKVEKELIAKGCEIVIVEKWRINQEGDHELIWSY